MVGGERHRREKRGGQEDKGETLLIKRLQRLMTVTWHFNFYYVIAKKKKCLWCVCAYSCVSVPVCACAQTYWKQHFSSPVICWECIIHYFSLTWCKAKTNSQRQARTHRFTLTRCRYDDGTYCYGKDFVGWLRVCVCALQGLNNIGLVVLVVAAENTQTQDRAHNTEEGQTTELTRTQRTQKEVGRWGKTDRLMDR